MTFSALLKPNSSLLTIRWIIWIILDRLLRIAYRHTIRPMPYTI
jgi:hypothetical protein